MRKTLIPVLVNAILCMVSPLLWGFLFKLIEDPATEDYILGAGCAFGAIVSEILLGLALAFNMKKDPDLRGFFW